MTGAIKAPVSLLLLAFFIVILPWCAKCFSFLPGCTVCKASSRLHSSSNSIQENKGELYHPSEIQDTGRVIAIGDVHGDFDQMMKCLRIGEAVDENGNWIGKDTIVVQTGDIFDRGDDEVKILKTLHRLKDEASGEGGDVVSLIGNHEVLSIFGDHSFVTEGAFASYNKLESELRAFHGKNWSRFEGYPRHEQCRIAALCPRGLFSPLLARHPLVLKVGRTLFCHGGLGPQHLMGGAWGLDALNRAVAAAVAGRGRFPRELLSGAGAVVWDRAYSSPESYDGLAPAARARLERALELVGCDRMVVGHTPQRRGINSAAAGRVWRVDVGLARCYNGGGLPQVLELVGDEARVVTEAGRLPGEARAARPPRRRAGARPAATAAAAALGVL